MAEIKVGQKYKPSEWWSGTSLPEHVKITEVHEESDTVCYVPGIFGATGSDDEGISTWEDRWILVEDVEDNQLSPNEDKVNHPSHYGGDTTYEVIKVAEAWGFDKDAYLFNVLKYIARAEHKGSERQDLEKAKFYLDRKIKRL